MSTIGRRVAIPDRCSLRGCLVDCSLTYVGISAQLLLFTAKPTYAPHLSACNDAIPDFRFWDYPPKRRRQRWARKGNNRRQSISNATCSTVPVAVIAATQSARPCTRRPSLLVEVKRPSDDDLLRNLDRIIHFYAEAANSALESCSLCQASFPQAVGKDRKVLGVADREPVREI